MNKVSASNFAVAAFNAMEVVGHQSSLPWLNSIFVALNLFVGMICMDRRA